jgi:hypothetical protein
VSKETSPEKYWESIAEEMGEPIQAYVLARFPRGEKSSGLPIAAGPEWGLAFLTESTLYIDRSSTPNWFMRIVSRNQEDGQREREVIPLRAVTNVKLPEERRGLSRLLAGPEIELEIEFQGAVAPLRMMLDRRGPTDATFVSTLTELISGLQSNG